MSDYLEAVCLLSDDDLRGEVQKYRGQCRSLHGRAWTLAYGRLLVLEKFLRDGGKDALFRAAVAEEEAERARLRASNAKARMQ